MNNPYLALHAAGRSRLADLAWAALRNHGHGDLPGWLDAIDGLPPGCAVADLDRDTPVLGRADEDRRPVRERLQRLHPWRKGPLELAGVVIDAEWRSDWKWKRIGPHLQLAGQQVLDVGCGNGYFGLRMLGAGARSVIGVDPTLVYVMQWLAMQKLCPGLDSFVLPLALEDLPAGTAPFDKVFSLGVLYHRRDPVGHLERLRELTRPGGQIVLETLVLEQAGEAVLEPGERYARMRNVHAIPTLAALLGWLRAAGLEASRLLDLSPTTVEEQRSTEWMRFESLASCLDPGDPSLTVEAHPAPVRAALLVEV